PYNAPATGGRRASVAPDVSGQRQGLRWRGPMGRRPIRAPEEPDEGHERQAREEAERPGLGAGTEEADRPIIDLRIAQDRDGARNHARALGDQLAVLVET